MQVSIYRLRDPRTNVTRYIGATTQPLSIRLSQHVCHGERKKRHAPWIKELTKIGLHPQISLIENVSESSWEDAEKFWISFYRKSGIDLLNRADGGKGNYGCVNSPEEREKKRIASTGRIKSSESRRKMSLAKLGIPRPYVAIRNKLNAKLSDAQVAEIRSIGLSESGVSLAKKYGVSTALISCIRNNKRRN